MGTTLIDAYIVKLPLHEVYKSAAQSSVNLQDTKTGQSYWAEFADCEPGFSNGIVVFKTSTGFEVTSHFGGCSL